MRFLRDEVPGFGGLLLRAGFHIHLGRQGADGIAQFLARLLDVRADLVDPCVGTRFRPSVFGLAHERASFTSWMSALTLSTLTFGGGPTSVACLRPSSAAIPATTNSTAATITAAAHTGSTNE